MFLRSDRQLIEALLLPLSWFTWLTWLRFVGTDNRRFCLLAPCSTGLCSLNTGSRFRSSPQARIFWDFRLAHRCFASVVRSFFVARNVPAVVDSPKTPNCACCCCTHVPQCLQTHGGVTLVVRGWGWTRYAAVFKAYVHRLLAGGQLVEAFLEGTRSRNGWSRAVRRVMCLCFVPHRVSVSPTPPHGRIRQAKPFLQSTGSSGCVRKPFNPVWWMMYSWCRWRLTTKSSPRRTCCPVR